MPISFTERGKKVLLESGAQDLLDQEFDRLKIKVIEAHPKTAYDVQEVSKKVVADMSSDDLFNNIKEYLFKEGLLLDSITEVMGIALRDRMLDALGMVPLAD